MSEKLPTLRDIKSNYSPEVNPFIQSVTIPVKKFRVRSGLSERPLVDAESGELVATSVIHQMQEMDTDQFVKVFAAGIALAYALGRTGQRVFQAVLQEYEQTPMHGGFADAVYLAWFDQGLSGRSIGMSEKTFNRGLRELLDKGFISARTPGVYWVNPALFFKGDRVMFINDYRRSARITTTQAKPDITATPHVVAPGDGASRPRQLKTVIQLEIREPTKPPHASEPRSVSPSAFRFGKKAKKRAR